MEESRKALYDKCKAKLLQMRQERLSGTKQFTGTLSQKVAGDEADMASALQDQHAALIQRDRVNYELREIAEALQRMEEGSYGVCEETGEPITPERLIALPWTRLSIEGAEVREKQRRKFA